MTKHNQLLSEVARTPSGISGEVKTCKKQAETEFVGRVARISYRPYTFYRGAKTGEENEAKKPYPPSSSSLCPPVRSIEQQ